MSSASTEWRTVVELKWRPACPQRERASRRIAVGLAQMKRRNKRGVSDRETTYDLAAGSRQASHARAGLLFRLKMALSKMRMGQI